jgi:hypothetical protein
MVIFFHDEFGVINLNQKPKLINRIKVLKQKKSRINPAF